MVYTLYTHGHHMNFSVGYLLLAQTIYVSYK